ncbi:MAG: peptidoglycan-binding protein [Clostridia bacterium]|nr:peptidoglycan-binding protein [Clostridia bacterium]
MKNRITKCMAMLAILCVLITVLAAPALAASYSKVYGQTQDRVRVRASASSSATVIDNIVKGACVYVTSSKTSGSSTFVKVNYRNSDGDVDSGWVCQNDGKDTYVKILSTEQAKKTFSVTGGNLPSRKVGTFTASERKKALAGAGTTADSGDVATIKSVQTMLKELGYYTGEITGKVGTKTEAAIKKFQKEYDLTADGVAGPNTIARLKAVYTDKGGSTGSSSSGSGLKLGSSGTKVRDLQQDLTTLGYYWADITGNFGSKTEAAVKNFQQKNNLTADGVAGSKTLSAIASAVARKGGTSASSGYPSGTTLKLNSQGSSVTQLQTDLKQLGYYYGSITGNFGEKTQDAVKEFQKAKGLPADGVAGSKTLAAVKTAIDKAGGSISSSTTGLKVGSTGEKVIALQQDLTALGYYYGDISGHYGSLTQAAVKKFQKAKGINQDGIAGTTTLNAIAKALGGSSGSSSTTALREGDSGSAVLELQTMLKERGYYYGSLTGNFGSLTKTAVRKFQDANGLTVDGIAGLKTLNLLRSQTGKETISGSTGSISSSNVDRDDSFFRINKDGVRLRTTYSLTSAAKTTMNKGTLVQATRKYNVGGTTWYNITVKKDSGNVYSGYVRSVVLDNISEETFRANGGNVDIDAADAEILGMIRITANSVSIRETASSSSEKMGSADKGDVFFYTGKSGDWYRIQSGYWIKDTYVHELDDDEIEDYMASGDYSGGTYREGDTGTMVTWIQESLKTLKYYSGNVSGNYGSLTKEAVRQFQKDNGLGADGVAGPKTVAKIMQKVSEKTAGGTGNAKYNSVIYNVDWFKNKDKINKAGIEAGKTVTMIDIATGKTMKIKVQSTGNHIDAEPLTASDTKVLCGLYGFTSASLMTSSNSWMRRAVIVQASNDTKDQFVGSIYAVPHGKNTISGNNFNGQFCIHLKGSTVHAGDGGSVPESKNHQAKIAAAVKELEALKNKDGTKVTSISEEYK